MLPQYVSEECWCLLEGVSLFLGKDKHMIERGDKFAPVLVLNIHLH